MTAFGSLGSRHGRQVPSVTEAVVSHSNEYQKVAPVRGKGLSIAAPILKTPGRTAKASPAQAWARTGFGATFDATFASCDPKVAWAREGGLV